MPTIRYAPLASYLETQSKQKPPPQRLATWSQVGFRKRLQCLVEFRHKENMVSFRKTLWMLCTQSTWIGSRNERMLGHVILRMGWPWPSAVHLEVLLWVLLYLQCKAPSVIFRWLEQIMWCKVLWGSKGAKKGR